MIIILNKIDCLIYLNIMINILFLNKLLNYPYKNLYNNNYKITNLHNLDKILPN